MSCPDCINGGTLSGDPIGTISTQNAYFSPAPNGSPSKRAVLLLTDVFGLSLKNPKIIADHLAKRLECDVWIPDYFNGNPIFDHKALGPAGPAGLKRTWMDWLKFLLAVVPRIPVYLQNRPSVIDAYLDKFISVIREEKGYEKIGAVGYCFGGSAAIRLAPTGYIQSVVICHPGRFSLEQAKEIKIPTAWLCAEEDAFFKDSLRDQVEALYASRKNTNEYVSYEFVIYKGTTHGFACRPDLSYEDLKQAYEKSLEDTAVWFEKTLSTA
ncbi:hypothetical protein AX17_004851 [Amanita inopinata Kibby_2008]|nr:hypothetical protein AX17_004851 [Amanita inopinata Kibby_2008]